jgi:hypothetical protein
VSDNCLDIGQRIFEIVFEAENPGLVKITFFLGACPSPFADIPAKGLMGLLGKNQMVTPLKLIFLNNITMVYGILNRL